jgi:hypothetical protein
MRRVEACVVLSNEHLTNFFLENFPQICIGLGEKNWARRKSGWLPIDKVWIPGHPGLANHIAEDFDRWFLERLERGELDQVLDMPDTEIELAGAVAPGTATTLA